MNTIKGLIREYAVKNDGIIRTRDVVEMAVKRGYSKASIYSVLTFMKNRGEIYKVKRGEYRYLDGEDVGVKC